jgi:hypothetical protein
MLGLQTCLEVILERPLPSVYRKRQEKPKGTHQSHPQHRACQEDKGVFLIEIKEARRDDGEHIYQDNHQPDLPPRDKMVPQRLDNLAFVVGELHLHGANILLIP